MKLLQSLLSGIICVAVIFSACKKNDIFTDRLSVGSLKDSSGNCLPSSVHGEYNSGTTLLVEHYIDVHVNVDTVGSYSIATDSMNGYFFKGTGTFGIKGDNLVRLYGHGTPLFGGVNIFTVRYGSSACRIAVNVKGTAAVPAVFTLDTLAGACPGVVLEGTFTSSIPATATNKAKLGVVVTTPGTYSITTTSINGISFSGTGAFTTAGPQTLVLTANGTPTASGAFNYTATVNGVSCTYSVTVAEGPSAAVFTLGGSPSTCTGFVLSGTYQAGTGLTSSNTVTCQVNVTTAGVYSLTTNSENGISFSGSGTFAATGVQTVILTATGTPISAGTNTFTVTAGANTCTFSITTISGTTSGSSIYVAGSESYNSFESNAKLWKNGIAGILPNTVADGTAYSVYVSGADVYAAGFSSPTNPNEMVATVWKNGVATSLTSSATSFANSFSVFVNGSDVYVVGYEEVFTKNRVAKIWKNGVATSLTDGTSNAGATSVFVSGSDVYVTGYITNSSGYTVATLWKNGNPVSLSSAPSDYSSAKSVVVVGSDVYVAGYVAAKATIWKNGVATTLSNQYSFANSIFVQGTDVYVAGTVNLAGTYGEAAIWKNGILTQLTNGIVLACANSIFVSGSDVYVAGRDNSKSAAIWKNGVKTILAAGTLGSEAYCVYVK